MSWIYLLAAGFFEIGFALSLKLLIQTKSFHNLFIFLVCLILSFYFLTMALKSIPIGTAYAIWTGIGTGGTVIAAIFIWGEPATISRALLLLLLLFSIIGLRLHEPC